MMVAVRQALLSSDNSYLLCCHEGISFHKHIWFYNRNEIEKVRKALEKDNSLSMEAMKNKMIEMSQNHAAAMDSLKQQYQEELDDLREKSIHSSKDLNDTEVQVNIFWGRSQYTPVKTSMTPKYR